MDASLVETVWQMAVLQRQLPAGLLYHSDRGSQYTSDTHLNQLTKLQCLISMSCTGNCYDNAAVESFFATIKAECADRTFLSKSQARTSISALTFSNTFFALTLSTKLG